MGEGEQTLRAWVCLPPCLRLMSQWPGVLEIMEGLVLRVSPYRISKTQDSHRTSQRSSWEDPVMVVYQKLEPDQCLIAMSIC